MWKRLSFVAVPNCILTSILCLQSALPAGEKETLFVAKPFTKSDSFTKGIEGPNCDKDGNVYAVNFDKDQTIGKVAPDGKGEIFVTLPVCGGLCRT